MTASLAHRQEVQLIGITVPSFENSAGGYRDDYSRSNRSATAIGAFEAPLSMVKRSYINRFIAASDASVDTADYLRSLPVAMWKWAAKEVGPESWHHTSSWYNATDHYSLVEVANYILADRDGMLTQYRDATKPAVEEKQVQVAVITVAEFSGSRRSPRFAGYTTRYGVLDGDWFYYRDADGSTKRYKADAGRVENLKTYVGVRALVAAHREFKGAGRVLRALAKERGASL